MSGSNALLRGALVGMSTTGLTVSVGMYYDQQTSHPMRQMQPYQWREGAMRLHNVIRPEWTLRKISLDELEQRYDGAAGRPTYFASDGYVWDVSDSAMFQQAYGLWKGKDASIALAKMSLDPNDVNRTDWDDLSATELESLHSWTTYFREKYIIRGRLNEFRSK